MTDASRLPRALRPFSSGQYRLLVAALSASLLSAGAWLVAAVWQVVELGGTPIDLSYVAVGASLGLVLAVLFGGVAADRIPQRYILLAVELVRGVDVRRRRGAGGDGCHRGLAHRRASRSCSASPTGSSIPRTRRGCPRSSPPSSCSRRTASRACCGPTVMKAAGPALASALIAVQAPWLAFAVVAALQGAAAASVLVAMRTTAVRRDPRRGRRCIPLRQTFIDLRDGFAYLLRTRWLFATLVFAIMLVFLIMGPIEVLLPVRGERPDRRRCRGVRARARRRSASAVRSDPSRSPRCASRVAT